MVAAVFSGTVLKAAHLFAPGRLYPGPALQLKTGCYDQNNDELGFNSLLIFIITLTSVQLRK